MKYIVLLVLICLNVQADERYNEEEIKQDFSRALSWVQEKSVVGYEKVKESLDDFKTDEDGSLLTTPQLMEKLQVKAEEGSAIAQYYLGLVYLHAKDAYYDRDKAISWLQLSTKNGCQQAADFLEKNKELTQ